jgi:hypothetical protein
MLVASWFALVAGLLRMRKVRVTDFVHEFVRFRRNVFAIRLLMETWKTGKMAEICQVVNTEFEKEPKECDGVCCLG